MRETFAIIQSILHYRTYLLGAKFTVYTDHKPLVEWYTLVPNSETYARWMVKLQGMTFEVNYIEGELNVLADLMSRPFEVARSSLEDFYKALKQRAEGVEVNVAKNTSVLRS